MKKHLFIAIFALFTIFSCQEKEKQLVILSTNDMHAHIDNYAKVAAYVEQERQKNPDILVLSGGDLFSGNAIVDHCPKYGNGYPIIDIMNKIGYQYNAIGNHEFDYGQEVLNDRINQANFKFLCSNMKVDNTAKIKQPEPYATPQLGDIKICIISAIEVENVNGRLLPASHPDKLKGVTFLDPIQTICSYKQLRKDCDVFIGLTHTGIDADKEIAEKMPELDLIIGAHTHTKLDTGIVVNNVLITQAAEYLKYIGKTTLTLKGKKIINKKYELINVDKLKNEDVKIKDLIKKYYDESPMNEVIGEASQQIGGKEALGNLMTDAITNVHHVDFAFQNSGGIRIGRIEKGNITMGKIYELDPFNNQIEIFEMKPENIRSMIKTTYQHNSKRVDLMVSGMTYKIFTKDGKAIKVELKLMNGKPLDENKYYKIGINDYISSSYKFEHKNEAIKTGKTSEETIIEYIKNQKQLTPQKPRTEVVGD